MSKEDEIEQLLEKEPEKSDIEESLVSLATESSKPYQDLMLGDGVFDVAGNDDDDEVGDTEDGEDPVVDKRLYAWKDPYKTYTSRESREHYKWVNPYKSLEERQKIKALYEPKPAWEYLQADDSRAVDQMTTTAPTDDKSEAKGKGRGRGRGRGGRRKGKGKGRKNKNRNKSKVGDEKMKSIIPSQPSFDNSDTQSDSVPSNDVIENTSVSKVSPALVTEEDDRDFNVSPAIARFQTCDQLHCKRGGRCVPDKIRGGVRCQCKLGTEGEFCENGEYNANFIE